ncbi:hypothetical protein RRF57_011738 [Xylaria bambusicola]|uniref:Uncharacterized protein n=1 Tax=Xylaria bambusicola TaxID=326684 RepID=A0AAN7UZW3_9PEZI
MRDLLEVDRDKQYGVEKWGDSGWPMLHARGHSIDPAYECCGMVEALPIDMRDLSTSSSTLSYAKVGGGSPASTCLNLVPAANL